MTIIQTGTGDFHQVQSQSHRTSVWLPGYIEVPQELEDKVWATEGYCELAVQDGVLIDVIPTEKPFVPKPESEPPTPEEQLRADIDFLAAMTGVTL